MNRLAAAVLTIGFVTTGVVAAHATVYNLALSGSTSGFTEGQVDFSGLHFDQYSVWLASNDFPITVAQGDTVNTTVTFDGTVTIPTSQVRTDLVQFLGSPAFPNENTQVDGAYNFYNGQTLVQTFSFSSTTSGGLSSFSAVFPPSNGAFSFNSFTDNFMVTVLPTPATLEESSFTYSLVSNLSAVPEPASWSLLLGGVGLTGAALRRRRAAMVPA